MEKIRAHPGFKEIPAEERHQIKSCCKEILPLAEDIKQRLLEKYEGEHEDFLRKEAEREREEKRRQEEQAKRAALDQIVRENTMIKTPEAPFPNIIPSAPSASSIGNHQYPYGTLVASEHDDSNALSVRSVFCLDQCQ